MLLYLGLYSIGMQLITQKTRTKQVVKETREDKAKALVGNVVRNEDNSYSVQSQSNPNKVYTIRLQLGAGQTQGYTCTCPDFEHRGQVGSGGAVEANCKHIIAVKLQNGDYEIEQTIKRMSRGAL